MSQNSNTNLHTLPVDLFHLIMDHLKFCDIYCSTWNVCERINTIIAIYRRYEVKFHAIKTPKVSMCVPKSIAFIERTH